jgi:hypothetical protein
VQIQDLRAIISQYESECGFIRRYFKPNLPAMKRLKRLAATPNNNISDEAIITILGQHWQAIKGTPRNYLDHNYNSMKATERAFVNVANKLNNSPLRNQRARVKATTLMPDIKSLTHYLDFDLPITRHNIYYYQHEAFLQELSIFEPVAELTIFNKRLQSYTIAQLRLLCQITWRTAGLKTTITLLIKDHDYVKQVLTCENLLACWNIPLTFINSSYFFKSQNNIGFDIRSLFFHKFLNPVNQVDLTQKDWEKLLKHPQLGLLLAYFKSKSMLDCFHATCHAYETQQVKIQIALPVSRPTGLKFAPWESTPAPSQTPGSRTQKTFRWVKSIFSKSQADSNVEYPVIDSTSDEKQEEKFACVLTQKNSAMSFCEYYELKRLGNFDATLTLESRQECYAKMRALADLMEHFAKDNFMAEVPGLLLRDKLVGFQKSYDLAKKEIVWSEMPDKIFFEKAQFILNQMKTKMDTAWDSSTQNFFNAMKEFSENPVAVIKRADESHIWSSGEYLVRVDKLVTEPGAIETLAMLVGQFKGAFEIAYRFNRLPALMRGMTPANICIAEKMKHLGSVLSQAASLGLVNSQLVNLDSVFEIILQDSRRKEISLGATWNDKDFLNHIVKEYAGKMTYLNEKQQPQLLSKEKILDYLIDIACFDLERVKEEKPQIASKMYFS